MATTAPITQLTPEQIGASQSAQWRESLKQYGFQTRVATPAFLVEDMDVATQTVSVQIAIQERVRTNKGAQWWDVPAVRLVPVVLPRGGGFALTLPLKKGDEGLLVFCDTCFDNWFVNGQNNSPPAQNTGTSSGSQTQLEVRRHHFWDCGFIPGMTSQPNVLPAYQSGAAQLRSEDGLRFFEVNDSAIHIKAPLINVDNGGATKALMTDTFYQWFIINVVPFLTGLGYTGPAVPAGSETTVLKGQ